MEHIDLSRLQGVERTMLFPLWGRYTESKKTDGLLHDRACVEMVEHNGIDLSVVAQEQHAVNRLAWMTRAWNLDRELQVLLAQEPESQLICLGCGLDTGFYRNDNGRLRWLDIDLPEVIAIRQALLAPQERCTQIAGSILDAGLYSSLASSQPTIVIALGLLYYFSTAEVKAIMGHLSGLSPSTLVIFDYCSELGVAMANKIILHNCSGTRMNWFANDPAQLLSLHPRLRIIENYPFFQKIMPFLGEQDRVMALQSDHNLISSIALCSLAG